MQDKIYLHLLILCVFWSQGITGTFADEETKESSDTLVRQKRVINRVDDLTELMCSFPYLVRIRQNKNVTCVGSILSNHVVITSAACAMQEPHLYQVASGSSSLECCDNRRVLDIRKHIGNYINRPRDGIALLIVDPPFVFEPNTRNIQLYSGSIPPGILGTISGWGFNFRKPDSGTCHRKCLRAIVVPVVYHQSCVNRYRPHIELTDKDICTYHPQKHCGHTDGGAPLVIDGFLAGVHLWTGLHGEPNDPQFPEVFASLKHPEYNQWVRTNLRNIDEQFQHHHSGSTLTEPETPVAHRFANSRPRMEH